MTLEELYPLPTEFVDLGKQDWDSLEVSMEKDGWARSESHNFNSKVFYRYTHFVNRKICSHNGPAYIETWAENPNKYYIVSWYRNNIWHRIDGPAIYQLREYDSKYRYRLDYYIDGKSYLAEDYWNNSLVVEAKLNCVLSDHEY